MKRRRILEVCASVLLIGVPLVSRSASFDCAKASTAIEQMICADSELSRMDENLAEQFRAAKAAAPDSAAFKKETNVEWRKRQRCADRDCLLAWYQRRSGQLENTLNVARNAETPPPTVSASAPVPSTSAPNDSEGVSGLVWLAGGLVLLWWAFKRLFRAERGQAAVTTGVAESGQIAAPSALSESRIAVRIVRAEPTEGSPSKRRQMRAVPTVWISTDQTISIATCNISGGMLYVGSTLTAPSGSTEPAQIDPTLQVDQQPVRSQERLFGYWPRYDAISPAARRAYLTWLAGGRQDPDADVGYVFLFFYGLERRVLLDAKTDKAAQAEIPSIVTEVERLRGIYGNHSFQNYTRDFLQYVAAMQGPGQALYSKEPPTSTENSGLPLQLRVGLGQLAVDSKPVPGTWALAWARSDPNISLPKLASRCQSLFDKQFERIYGELFADGLKLGVNRTKLSVSYRPASSGLLSEKFTLNFGDLPDVTAVVTPLKKLQTVVDEAAASLGAYSRFIGRHADRAASVEAAALLPKELWNPTIKAALETLDQRVGTGMCVVRVQDLLTLFNSPGVPTRELTKILLGVLRSQDIGVEPDIPSGAKTPKSGDSVVLFRMLAKAEATAGTAEGAYAAVAVMLDLAITLANADGTISGREVQFLNRQVDAWSHVGESGQRRLRARLRLGIIYPPTLASLKSRLEPLPKTARVALAKLLAALATADGAVDSAEVKHLEKIYALLGIDRGALYTELHGVAAAVDRGKSTSSSAGTPSATAIPNEVQAADTTGSGHSVKASGMQLDPSRIASLQAETERVTELLSAALEEEPSPDLASTEPDNVEPEETSETSPRLLGLNAENSAFLRMLLTRHSWSRAELTEIAADMEIMLDGALEQINEAALDRFDARIAEGDDQVEIAQDLIESTNA